MNRETDIHRGIPKRLTKECLPGPREEATWEEERETPAQPMGGPVELGGGWSGDDWAVVRKGDLSEKMRTKDRERASHGEREAPAGTKAIRMPA